jgi:hypothetical protein
MMLADIALEGLREGGRRLPVETNSSYACLPNDCQTLTKNHGADTHFTESRIRQASATAAARDDT